MTTAGHHDILAGVTAPVAPVQLSQGGALNALRCLTLIGALLLIWLTLDPFTDLRNPDLDDIATGQLVFTYVSFGILALVTFALCVADNVPALRSLGTPVNLCFLGWLLLNVAMSHFPAMSLQRLVLTASATAIAFMIPLLPNSRLQLNLCLAIAAGLLLGICYLGLLLVPDLAMHTARDTVEPQLAGDWRGAFAHKNIAAPVMAMLIYLGVYLMRTELRICGILITLGAAIFLLNAGGKSASSFCIAILLLVQIVSRLRSLWLKSLLCFGPVLLINLLTVGSVASPAIASLVGLLPIDTTFTGRTDIWEFALSGLYANPILGYGYGAFWNNPANQTTAAASIADWAVGASHSHNGYLELALTIGLPGLILAILVLLVMPLRDYQRVQDSDQNRPLADFFLTVWLFGIYLSSMETFLLDKQNPTWFVFAIAVSGLHYLSRFRLRQHDADQEMPAYSG